MARGSISLPQVEATGRRGFLETTRKDTWWLFPAVTFVYFLAALVYLTWGAWQGSHYYFGGADAQGYHAQYLSPAFSPLLWVDSSKPGAAPVHHAWFGEWPDWLPKAIWFIPLTPAFLILLIPGGFRFTCYYYRGAYYKAFWGDPPNCAVGEPGFRKQNFRGERWAPLVLMNIHRYFMYLALLFIVILSYDAVQSFIFAGPDNTHRFGIGIGSLVITANAVLLAFYTFGCHSLRHVIGGVKDCVSASPARFKAYQCVGCFNRWHMQWAWISLFWVCFTDLYIRLCSMGIWTDWRII
jgi:hypothetical protein